MLCNFSPHTLPKRIYDSFIKDGIRLYVLLPEDLRFSFWVIFILQFFTALMETFTLLVISLFAMSVAAPETAANHAMVRPFLALIPSLAEYCAEPRNMVTFTCCLMVGFVACKGLLSIFTMHKTGLLAERVTLYVGQETIRRYLHKSYLWHMSPASQTVTHQMLNRGSLAQFLILLLQLYGNVLCCAILFTSLSLAEPTLTLIVVGCFSSASLLTYMALRHSIDRAGKLVNTSTFEESVSTSGMLHGIREILIYHRQDVFLRNTMAAVYKGLPARAFLAFANTMPTHFLEFIGFSTIASMIIVMLAVGSPMPEIIAASSILMLTAWRVLPVVNRSLSFSVAIRGLRLQALSCLNLLESFIAEDLEALPEPDPQFRFVGSLTLEEASFRYPSAAADALHDISLSIAKGESIGLIGPSGAGKSTLALLFTGLVPPTAGRFLVDGESLTSAGTAAYVQQVGFVPQAPLLVGGTVADNVAFSQWGEAYDREAVLEACRMAAMDFVLGHPQGIDMPLAANGAGLSGGQAQRVSIARALFTRPAIIIFDEATSALDQGSENIIASTIRQLQRTTTTIIIAHRMTTVERCDRLIWLEAGRIHMIGAPEKILPLYREAMERIVALAE